MSFSGGGIGSTLTGGIQDIAGILPLLGTEQCSIHVNSALSQGYLYAASPPMSIFGSLGVVSAGFKTLVGCSHSETLKEQRYGIRAARREPLIDYGKGENKGRFIIENRIGELNIHKKKTDNWGNPQVCCLG